VTVAGDEGMGHRQYPAGRVLPKYDILWTAPKRDRGGSHGQDGIFIGGIR
jgi:hypothetical protein